MCDTLIALGNATVDGSVIFAKNSDREPNEAHEILVCPAEKHTSGSMVKCTYIEVPQVEETFAVLLAKPFNIWGAEMGANEHGVVIGNEAVFTRVPYDKGPGLTGMDMIRLAVERAATARQALDVIVQLLEANGQGGNCGFAHPFYYHNSFIIGDPRDAWVLETAGKQWAAVQVKDVRTISNQITIGREWDLASSGLVDYAVDRGWCRQRSDFDFGKCYSDPLMTYFSASGHRRNRSSCLLEGSQGKFSVERMMAALRDHGDQHGEGWKPDRGLTGSEMCMHAGFGPVRINQTVGSMVSHLRGDGHTHWVTATSAPCTGVFKPVWIDAGTPDYGESPGRVVWSWLSLVAARALAPGSPERLPHPDACIPGGAGPARGELSPGRSGYAYGSSRGTIRVLDALLSAGGCRNRKLGGRGRLRAGGFCGFAAVPDRVESIQPAG